MPRLSIKRFEDWARISEKPRRTNWRESTHTLIEAERRRERANQFDNEARANLAGLFEIIKK